MRHHRGHGGGCFLLTRSLIGHVYGVQYVQQGMTAYLLDIVAWYISDLAIVRLALHQEPFLVFPVHVDKLILLQIQFCRLCRLIVVQGLCDCGVLCLG